MVPCRWKVNGGFPCQKANTLPRLRELGCKPWSEILDSEEMEDVNQAVGTLVGTPSTQYSRSKRRALLAQGLVPHFVFAGDYIFILDEMFVDWKGPLGIESALKDELGFKNLGEGLSNAELRQKMN